MSDTVKIKTADLIGPALDWAVGHIEGFTDDESLAARVGPNEDEDPYHPSTDWSQSGPIIERERIALLPDRYDKSGYPDGWIGSMGICGQPGQPAPFPLIAAMRCYVASKLGDELDIPAELAPEQSKKMKP